MTVISGKGTISSFGKEWIGLVGAFFWFFSLMCSYDETLMNGTVTLAVYMLVLAVSLLLSALLADRFENIFRRIIVPSGVAGFILTASLGFLPNGFLQIAFCLIPATVAPLLCRRLFGVWTTVSPRHMALGYISAVSLTIILHIVWLLLPVSGSVHFAISAIAVLVGLWRIASHLPSAGDSRESQTANASCGSEPKRHDRSAVRRVIAGSLFLLLLSVFNIFCSFLHTAVLRGTFLESDIFAVIAFLLMPFSFLFFAWMTDRGQSRRGFLIGLGMVFAGCCVAILPSESLWKAPLLIFGEFGGTITEYTLLTATLTIFRTSRQRYLTATAGLILHTLLASFLSWTADLFMPAFIPDSNLTRGFVVFGTAVAFLLVLLYF